MTQQTLFYYGFEPSEALSLVGIFQLKRKWNFKQLNGKPLM